MLWAPTKLEKRAQMVDHDTNHRKAARNASDVKLDTSSMCAAFVAKHTKTQTYAFMSTGRRVCPFLSVNGPAKSMPVR